MAVDLNREESKHVTLQATSVEVRVFCSPKLAIQSIIKRKRFSEAKAHREFVVSNPLLAEEGEQGSASGTR